MSDMDVKFIGLDELAEDFARIAVEAPDAMAKAQRKVVNKFKREVIKKTPVQTKRLAKSYRLRDEGFGDMRRIIFYATAPHFHLAERGHRVVPRKAKNGGEGRKSLFGGESSRAYVHGVKMVENTVKEYEDKYGKELSATLEKTLKR